MFRRHLGTAIITRDHPDWPPEVLDDWYDPSYRHQPLEEQIEREVSQYVGDRWTSTAAEAIDVPHVSIQDALRAMVRTCIDDQAARSAVLAMLC